MLKGTLLKQATASNVAPAPIGWAAVNSAKFGYYIRFYLVDGSYTDRVLPGSYDDMKALAPSLKADQLNEYPLPTPKVVKW